MNSHHILYDVAENAIPNDDFTVHNVTEVHRMHCDSISIAKKSTAERKKFVQREKSAQRKKRKKIQRERERQNDVLAGMIAVLNVVCRRMLAYEIA